MICDALCRFCDENGIRYSIEEDMSRHTSFRIGSAADVFIRVDDESALSSVLAEAEKLSVPVFILGNGTNILVSDNGIEGAVITLDGMNGISVKDNIITAYAGAPLSSVCTEARKAGLSGLEFAYGIPGSVGGAVFMNAGAYGGEMKDVISEVSFIGTDKKIHTLPFDECNFGYRTSVFKTSGGVVTSVKLRLTPGDKDGIRAAMDGFMERRRSKQPLDFPSAGSTFKRPEGNFAGTLIEKNGLKGYRIGGAEVSEKHAGFVINRGGATCKDVLRLIKHIQNTVLDADGVKLEPEVIFVGRAMPSD